MTWISKDLDIFPQSEVDAANEEAARMRAALRLLPTPEQRRAAALGNSLIETTGITQAVPITPETS